jgi:hypothetical protein
MLSRISFDIDEFNTVLAPMLKYMKPASRIGFAANTDPDGQSLFFYSSKFTIAPQILLFKNDLDTLLVVQLKSSRLLTFPDYNIIGKYANNSKLVLLLVKQK